MQIIKKTEFNVAWLICFYIGDMANLKDLNLQMKKFSINGANLGKDLNVWVYRWTYCRIFLHNMQYILTGKINCGRNGQLCNKLGINRYPVWGMLKPGGAFELNHGKATNNDIIKFIQIGVKTTNIRALSAEEALSILQGDNGAYYKHMLHFDEILQY